MTRRSERIGRVLRVRRVQEERARVAWLSVEGAARDSEDRTEALRAAHAAMTVRLGDDLGTLSSAWVLLSHDQISLTARRTADQRERAATLRAQADAAREPWTERRAAARGLERLVDRARARERADELAAEVRQLDELNVARAARHPRSER